MTDVPDDEIISDQELLRFFGAMIKSWTCEACEGSEFTIVGEASSRKVGGIVFFGLPGRSLGRTFVHDVVQTNCVRCGNIRLHYRPTIKNWLAANPLPSSEAGGND